MQFSQLFQIGSICLLFSATFAAGLDDDHKQATPGVGQALDVALTVAQLFNYELRSRSIERPVALDMITAIASHSNPLLEDLPSKFRKILHNTLFRRWQKRIRNITAAIKNVRPSKKRKSDITTQWRDILLRFNKQSAREHFPVRDGSDFDAFRKINNALKPHYAAILGNLQVLKHALIEPIATDEYNIIVHNIQRGKSVLDRLSYRSESENARSLVDYARYCIDRLLEEMGMVGESTTMTETIPSSEPSTTYD